MESTYSSDFDGKSILEVGSKYVNGSVRPYVFKISRPKSYLGVDIEEGRFVDKVVDAARIVANFGEESFDVVISTEMVEHVEDWRLVITNIKRVLKKGGLLVLTTVSRGFLLHNYPSDYWRYELSDLKRIFADFQIITVASNEASHGVYIKAVKPSRWVPCDLSEIELYSMSHAKEIAGKYETVTFRMRRTHYQILKFLFHRLLRLMRIVQ